MSKGINSSAGINFQQQQQLEIHQMQPSSSTIPGNFNISKYGAYDLGELDQALFHYLDNQPRLSEGSEIRPHTLNIFPSQPMHVAATPSQGSIGLVDSSGSSGSKRSSAMDFPNPRNAVPEKTKLVKREGNHKGASSSSEQEKPKTPDPKTLRRLAQNREAARKSRLRKKAYVQQLESCRIRLSQLEQEVQRARSQGVNLGGIALLPGDQAMPTITSAALFDMEYGLWLEEHHRLTVALRNAFHEHLPENELQIFVDNCLAHYDEMMSLKAMMAKSDVFHILSCLWKTPAERCFMWVGGFRPLEIIKIMMSQVEALAEQQLVEMCSLQQSTQEAEEALSQGMEGVKQSLSETLVSDSLMVAPNMERYMSQMAAAIDSLSSLQAFLTQADNLRQQTLHRVHQILTTRQSACCFLAIAEYFHRLRALSGLWLAHPRNHD